MRPTRRGRADGRLRAAKRRRGRLCRSESARCRCVGGERSVPRTVTEGMMPASDLAPAVCHSGPLRTGRRIRRTPYRWDALIAPGQTAGTPPKNGERLMSRMGVVRLASALQSHHCRQRPTIPKCLERVHDAGRNAERVGQVDLGNYRKLISKQYLGPIVRIRPKRAAVASTSQ